MGLKWEVRKRLEEIECRLYWVGRLSRADLMGKFGISPQQASADIARYRRLATENTVFNRSAKHYEPSADFAPLFINPSLVSYTYWSDSVSAKVATTPTPLRDPSLPSLQTIARALHNGYSLQIEYQSLSSETRSKRRITPHTIVFDGYRHHVRAYCHLKKDFRDFVLGRIFAVRDVGEPGLTKQDDEAWNTSIILRIGSHPDLNASQQAIIQKDFGMKNGELQLRVRQAMLFYTLAQLRLDRFVEQRNPSEQQIVLLNPEVLSYN